MQGGYQGGYAGQPGQQQQGGYGGPPAMGQQQQQGGYGGPPMGQPPGGYGGPPSGQFQQNNSNNNQQMQGGGGGYPQQYGGGYQQQNQQGYPPQQNQQQGYPPQQQQGGYQQQQGGYQQQQGGYQQQMPPQNQGGYPPQQQFNQQQSFPPQQQQYGAPPQQYGAPQQFSGGPMVPPSGAGGPYGSGPVVMQQGAGGMVAGAMQIYYPPSIIPVSMPGKPPRGRTMHPEWNVVHDAQRLRSAIKGVGTDNSTLIDIICNRDREHLQYVRLAYRDQFHKHLHKEIESDTSFFFRDTLMGLVMSDAEFRAYILRKATKGAGTRDSVLIDVICTARGSEALLLKAAYQGMYGGNLESVIKSECSGNYEKLLVALMRGTRPDWGIMQQTMSSDVNILYKATEGRLGTDERTVIETLVARSTDHLWALNQAYVQRSKKRRTFRQCLDSETSGNFKVALNAVMTDPCHWFAERIHKAAKGLGTNDTMLISNILLPNQWQLQEVVRILQQEYHKDLIQLIRKETSGHYRDALCAYVANCLRP